MKRSLTVLLLFFHFFFLPFCNFTAEAQRPYGMPRERHCSPVEELGLTDEQRSSIERINAEILPQISRLRFEFMERRMELERLLRDVRATEDSIRKKSKEVVNAHNLLQERILEYQLRLRIILTHDQLNRCCIIFGPFTGPGRWGMPWR